VRYYLERRDPEFEPKIAEVLCVYREIEMRRAAGGAGGAAIAVVSYDASSAANTPSSAERCKRWRYQIDAAA
jgi:hypothetical protein